MTDSSPSFTERERQELADLLAVLGPAGATCLPGWDTAHMAAHVVIRDRRPDAMPGFALERHSWARPLAAWSHSLEDRLRQSTPYATVVQRARSGPPSWLPQAWPVVERALNTAEFAIHHEDVRRAQPGWAPRELPREAQDALWHATGLFARRAAAGRSGGLVLRRTDVPGQERRFGDGGRTVEGEPMELLLWASGRREVARVTVS
jgi:uncharacterized protein (TIGR03085 family)